MSVPERAGRHVVLVGLSGSGKSTVGPLLAQRLGRQFVDTDALIERAAGRPIPDLFATEGEPAFRIRERQAVQEAMAAAPSVIATGGGAPTVEETRILLWERNLVVWLDAPVAVLAVRVGAAGSGRPLLAGAPAQRLASLHAARAPIYATAHLRVDTANLAPAAVVEQIATMLAAGDVSFERCQ